VLKKWLS